jgi:hypothetical protein
MASATLFTSFVGAGLPDVSDIATKNSVKRRAAIAKRWIDETILKLRKRKRQEKDKVS